MHDRQIGQNDKGLRALDQQCASSSDQLLTMSTKLREFISSGASGSSHYKIRYDTPTYQVTVHERPVKSLHNLISYLEAVGAEASDVKHIV